MDITKLEGLNDTAELELEYKGEKVKFTAKKNTFTPGFLNLSDSPEKYARAIVEAVTEWDVFDGDEQWPLTPERIEQLPVPFLSAVLAKIAEQWGADKKKQQA